MDDQSPYKLAELIEVATIVGMLAGTTFNFVASFLVFRRRYIRRASSMTSRVL